MILESFQLSGIRCFDDTGVVSLSPGINIFVGQNNAGKSSILRSIASWQLSLINDGDFRVNSQNCWQQIILAEMNAADKLSTPQHVPRARFIRTYRGSASVAHDETPYFTAGDPFFKPEWPAAFIVPFAAKRKATGFSETVSLQAQRNANGTFENLYSRIDRVASPGTRAHEIYKNAIQEILGVFITTTSSLNGKTAGYYYDESNFITLERMGDGVAEVAALIVELSMAEGKLFILEEPETNLHPRGLKALLGLIRESAKSNQFIIATHSNIVVRELAVSADSKLFRVYKEKSYANSVSVISEVPRTKVSHRELLDELGYEFGDLDLHDCWLILEESSAESIIREILIPRFAPQLAGKVRTFSAAGADNIEPSVFELQRLITFIHLEPVYQDRLWVRADGDGAGRSAIQSVCQKFPYLAAPKADTFSEPYFENYYPSSFAERVAETMLITGKRERREAKAKLLQEVLQWSKSDPKANELWADSAGEIINMLAEIASTLK